MKTQDEIWGLVWNRGTLSAYTEIKKLVAAHPKRLPPEVNLSRRRSRARQVFKRIEELETAMGRARDKRDLVSFLALGKELEGLLMKFSQMGSDI